MARSVDEVNNSIECTKFTISEQEYLISDFNEKIDKNNNEREVLKRQKATLEATLSEINVLCDNLKIKADSFKNTYGVNNNFAKEYSEAMTEKIENFCTDSVNKLNDMIDKLDRQINKCETDILNAQTELNNANTALAEAQYNLEVYNTELVEAQAEEEANLLMNPGM